MNLKPDNHLSTNNSTTIAKHKKGIGLSLLLVVPFVLQIFFAVGITGYLSFRNGQKAVHNLAFQLSKKIGNDIEHNVIDYFLRAENFHQMIVASIRSKNINLADFKSLEQYFWHQIQTDNVADIFFANVQGDIVGIEQREDGTKILRIKDSATGNNRHKYILDNQGNRTKLIENKEYFTTARPWYKNAVKAGKSTWSNIYSSTDLLNPEISAVVPIYNQTGELEGILGSELTLENINNFLRNLEIAKSGEAFIIERDGKLVATSTPEVIFTIVDGQEKRILAQNSSNFLIKSTTRHLLDKLKSLEQLEASLNSDFKWNGETQLVQIKPLKNDRGVDFLIVIVMPQSDFMAEINANTRITILLCITSLLVAIVLGMITSDWITSCINRLNDASRAISNGNLEQIIEVKGIHELRVLANYFNQMASQLKISFTQLDTTNQKLAQTNTKLDYANQELAQTNQELEERVDRRTHQLQVAKERAEKAQQTAEYANQELAQTNQELEERVDRRTHQLQVAKERAEKAQQTAEIANKAKSTFLANISHELRTPLNAILGFTQIMQRDKEITRSQLKNLAIINGSSEHLLALINDVLDMSKIEAGRINLNLHSFDLHRLLDTTEEMLGFKADAKGLQFLCERHPDTPQYIRTDERKLRQVFINLLNNAIKFTNEGGITLRVSPVIGHSLLLPSVSEEKAIEAKKTINIYFEIEDTGAGIPTEELETIFEAFTQTETGRQSEEGTGLGLPISRKFVELMGGNISVSSQLEEGTVFKFNIVAEPAIEAELKPQQNCKKVIGLEANQPSYRILVVDDRWENRQIVCQLLKPIGFEVKEAINGKEAVEIWSEWQPHLIWMDIRMPVMNGYEATKYIKSHLKGQGTYIIALTASTFEEERAIVLSAEFDDFVRKPFREEVIFSKTAEYLELNYIYAKNSESEAIKARLASRIKLESESLQVMSSEWLTQLEQAASELDEELIAKLLEQIPDEHILLKQALQNKVDDFDFDDIVNLVQQIINMN